MSNFIKLNVFSVGNVSETGSYSAFKQHLINIEFVQEILDSDVFECEARLIFNTGGGFNNYVDVKETQEEIMKMI